MGAGTGTFAGDEPAGEAGAGEFAGAGTGTFGEPGAGEFAGAGTGTLGEPGAGEFTGAGTGTFGEAGELGADAPPTAAVTVCVTTTGPGHGAQTCPGLPPIGMMGCRPILG